MDWVIELAKKEYAELKEEKRVIEYSFPALRAKIEAVESRIELVKCLQEIRKWRGEANDTDDHTK